MDIKRFDIVKVDLSDAKGHEQGKIRPCIVVGNDLSNKYSPVIIVIPLTHNTNKTNIPTHGIIKKEDAIGLKTDSLVEGEQPRAIDKTRIIKKIGIVKNSDSKKMIDKVCYNAFFYSREEK